MVWSSIEIFLCLGGEVNVRITHIIPETRSSKVRSQRKKNDIIWEVFPKLFCKFTKYFFVCQIHSEVQKHVLQMGGSDILSISTFNHYLRILKIVAVILLQ